VLQRTLNDQPSGSFLVIGQIERNGSNKADAWFLWLVWCLALEMERRRRQAMARKKQTAHLLSQMGGRIAIRHHGGITPEAELSLATLFA
jgi:hypothetical protein